MHCYWYNGAFCLEPENNKEAWALEIVHDSFRAGLKPHPHAHIRHGVVDLIPSSKDTSEQSKD